MRKNAWLDAPQCTCTCIHACTRHPLWCATRAYTIQNSGLHFTCMYKKVNKIVIHLHALHLLSVAVIILEQSFECRSTYITEGNNATACATIVYTYGDLPLATNISVLFTTSNGSALSTYVEA